MEIYDIMQNQFKKMCETGNLFRANVSGHELWDRYIKGFENPKIFRDPNSNEHNCNTCQAFFAHFANIVAIDDDNNVMTLFDECGMVEYEHSFSVCRDLVLSNEIRNRLVLTTSYLQSLCYKHTNDMYTLGVAENNKIYTKEEAATFGVVEAGKLYTFRHYALQCPMQFIRNSRDSIERIEGEIRSSFDVFYRGLSELSVDTLSLVRDLVNQGSILDGNAHLDKINEMLRLKEMFDKIDDKHQRNWAWKHLSEAKYPKFRNELIGTLCNDIESGVELNKACHDWNYRVDPQNYMKAKAPITQQQINEAMKFVQENGCESAFTRRHATLDDIKACDILHMNYGTGQIKPVSIFDNVKPTATKHAASEFKGVPEVSIENFLKDVLPSATGLEIYVTAPMKKHLVALTAPMDDNAKRIFKWDNDYSWTYKGNLAGVSQIKEAVKSAGGFVDAPFRFSIMWNEDGKSIVDFDAHAKEPTGCEIYFGSFKGRKTDMSGMLDIDMINPPTTGVENIFWTDMNKVRDGKFKFWVHNYNNRSNHGFKAEIFINGESFQYAYNGDMRGNMDVAEVTIKDGKLASVSHNTSILVESEVTSTTIWGIDTCKFHKVNLVCLSPNHWEDNKGNKHYMFMVDGCKSDEPIRGFHVENLSSDLLAHRKVMEVLANTTMIEPADKQLAGFGYDETVRDSVIVRVDGTHKRVLKVNF